MSETSTQPTGRLIVLEGPDGSGKTTQAERLAAWIATGGREVVTFRDPGGTSLGEQVRTIVKDRAGPPISMRAEMLLFMSSRAQLVEEVIAPALARGAVVVGDRFLLSNVVYQGYAGGLDIEEIWRVGLVATGGLLPDLTLIVDVTPEVAAKRTGPARDRIEDRGEAYQNQVRDGFLTAAWTYPAPIAVVDGSSEPGSVAVRLQREVKRALAIAPRP